MSNQLPVKAFANVIGVSDASLKRWIDEGRLTVSRTAGGHRRIDLTEAIRFIRQQQLPIVDPRPLGLPMLDRLLRDRTIRIDHDEALYNAIVNGEADLARALTLSVYMSGQSLARICDGPLRRAMYHVGELWLHDEHGIHLEHRATDVCIQCLEQLRWIIPHAPEAEYLAIGGAAEGDPYMIPSLMTSVVLQDRGWRTINLGPNLPLASLQRAVDHHQPNLVWLSLSIVGSITSLKRQIIRLAPSLGTDRTFVVGGQTWRPPRRPVEGLTNARTMADLITIAQRVEACSDMPVGAGG